MQTLSQIIPAFAGMAAIATAIAVAIAYLLRLGMRVSSLELFKLQVGEAHLPKTAPEAKPFFDPDKENPNPWRKIAVRIAFNEPFKTQPEVMVALKRLDLGDYKSNIHRIGVRAHNVTINGFDLWFETWYESLVFDATAAWIAFSLVRPTPAGF